MKTLIYRSWWIYWFYLHVIKIKHYFCTSKWKSSRRGFWPRLLKCHSSEAEYRVVDLPRAYGQHGRMQCPGWSGEVGTLILPARAGVPPLWVSAGTKEPMRQQYLSHKTLHHSPGTASCKGHPPLHQHALAELLLTWGSAEDSPFILFSSIFLLHCYWRCIVRCFIYMHAIS